LFSQLLADPESIEVRITTVRYVGHRPMSTSPYSLQSDGRYC
jgi:hypothetical protein